MSVVTGSCLCGAVRYELTGPFLRAGHCHCSRCRKHSGAAASTQGRVLREHFRLVAGGDLVRVHGRGEGSVKAFCRHCGSSLFGGTWPEGREVSIRLGSVDGDPGIRPQYHTFVDARAPWDAIDDDLPRFGGALPATPGEGSSVSRTARPVLFYFDFISPYSWLALVQAKPFARAHGVRFDLRPVVYAKLLDETGLVGPAEVPAKRRYTVRDVARCARRIGVRLKGPPAHPFRSLEALRTACLFRADAAAVDLCAALADAAWGQGRDLTDLDVIAEVVAGAGLDASDLAARVTADAVKEDLRALTAEALAGGVFGVPTFALDGELFWGHDRLPHLADRLAGRLPPPSPEDDAVLLRRPRGAQRQHGPGGAF